MTLFLLDWSSIYTCCYETEAGLVFFLVIELKNYDYKTFSYCFKCEVIANERKVFLFCFFLLYTEIRNQNGKFYIIVLCIIVKHLEYTFLEVNIMSPTTKIILVVLQATSLHFYLIKCVGEKVRMIFLCIWTSRSIDVLYWWRFDFATTATTLKYNSETRYESCETFHLFSD